jgi:hypothetical protein
MQCARARRASLVAWLAKREVEAQAAARAAGTRGERQIAGPLHVPLTYRKQTLRGAIGMPA